MARYPHLEIPWDSKDAIVNQVEYNRAFEVPGKYFIISLGPNIVCLIYIMIH